MALINAKELEGWTSWFLWTTVLTSVTGFMFPFHGFQPSYVVGAISMVVLAAGIVARRHLATGWKKTYAISVVPEFVRPGSAAFPPRAGAPLGVGAAIDGQATGHSSGPAPNASPDDRWEIRSETIPLF
jgi:hypothetical protein